jgi:elongation factor G
MNFVCESQVISADAPLAEMLGYARAIRATTQGCGSFSMEFSSFAAVPAHVQRTLVAQ